MLNRRGRWMMVAGHHRTGLAGGRGPWPAWAAGTGPAGKVLRRDRPGHGAGVLIAAVAFTRMICWRPARRAERRRLCADRDLDADFVATLPTHGVFLTGSLSTEGVVQHRPIWSLPAAWVLRRRRKCTLGERYNGYDRTGIRVEPPRARHLPKKACAC